MAEMRLHFRVNKMKMWLFKENVGGGKVYTSAVKAYSLQLNCIWFTILLIASYLVNHWSHLKQASFPWTFLLCLIIYLILFFPLFFIPSTFTISIINLMSCNKLRVWWWLQVNQKRWSHLTLYTTRSSSRLTIVNGQE